MRPYLIAMCLAASLYGNEVLSQTTASIQGYCKDSRGNPIAGAVVLYNNPATGQTYTLRVNARGEYLSLGVNPGKYRVLVYKSLDDQKSGAILYEIDGYEVKLTENWLNIDPRTVQEYVSAEHSPAPNATAAQAAQPQRNPLDQLVQIDDAMPSGPQGEKTVPPPPKLAGEGPSLEVTMRFIQDKLSDVGPVNFAVYGHDDAGGGDSTMQQKIEVTKVFAAPGACLIKYHWNWEKEGKVVDDHDGGFFLKTVRNIAVTPIDQYQKKFVAAAGHPSWSYRDDPPVFVLEVRKSETKGANTLVFFDEQLANRVAKALVHAVELCGGGTKPEPF